MGKNVVVIICDQMRKDFLSCYGGKGVPTPNIDFLAEQGVVYDCAITQAPVCAPARASIMTGRYVSDHKVWTNDVPFREGLEFLAERMNENGYETGAFGKLHHYPGKDTKGFQTAFLMEENRLGEDDDYLQWLHQHKPDARIFNSDNMKLTYSLDSALYYERYIASKAVDFIEDCVTDSKKFFAYVSFQGPHTPIDPPKEFIGTVESEALPKPFKKDFCEFPEVVKYRSVTAAAHYLGKTDHTEEELAFIRTRYAEQYVAIDHEIGRIITLLKEKGQFENTVFLFTADHGDLIGDFGLHYKGPMPYRGQLEIPLILSGHPGLPKGSRSDELCGNMDIGSTVLSIAGDDRPLGYSKSLLDTSYRRPVVYSEFCDSVKMVRTSDYLYAYYPFTGQSELFDKRRDPDELINLSGSPDCAQAEAACLKHMVDFMVIAKGVRIEAHDVTPLVKKGIEEKNPDFLRDFPIAFPVATRKELEQMANKGLDPTYNEFCEDKEIFRHYGAYWISKS